VLQLSGNESSAPATLAGLRRGQQGVVEGFDLPEDVSRRMMELGFLPGAVVTVGRGAPGGDPKIFRVDGAEVALRRETARRIRVRPARNG
jgi:ferrous iron transport protein A